MSSWKGAEVEFQKIRLRRLFLEYIPIYSTILLYPYKLTPKLYASFLFHSHLVFQALRMLEHATYLETVALRLHHDAVCTISATLVGTNTAKIFNLLEGTFGVDFPKDEEDDYEEVEYVTSEEEEHLPQTGMTSHAAAQSVDIAKSSQPSES